MRRPRFFTLIIIATLNSCVTTNTRIYKNNSELSEKDLETWKESVKNYKQRISLDLKDYRKALVSTSTTKPMLWKIEKSGYFTSFLFGTIHSGISWHSFPLGLKSCVKNANLIIFESIDDLDLDASTKKKIRKQQTLDNKQGFAKDVGGKAWENYRSEMIIINERYLATLTPRNARNLFYQVKDNYVRGEQPQLDHEIMEYAHSLQKNMTQLDSQEDLNLVIDNIVSNIEPFSADDFKQTFGHDPYLLYRDYVKKQYELEFKYKFAQIEEIEKIISNLPSYDLLISRRNANWMPKIAQHLQQYNSFIVVGVGHMTGKDSLLKKLTEHGFKITTTDGCVYQ